MSYDRRLYPKDPFWNRMGNLAPLLDTRDYTDTHPYFLENGERVDELKWWQKKNAYKIGMMRDEGEDRYLVSSVVALKPKVSMRVCMHRCRFVCTCARI